MSDHACLGDHGLGGQRTVAGANNGRVVSNERLKDPVDVVACIEGLTADAVGNVCSPAQFGIASGDYAAVLFKAHLAFAVFGDSGPPIKIGEGSIELLRLLGQERIRPNGTVINAGMGPRVLTIVFPGSGDRLDRADQRSLLDAMNRKAGAFFEALRA